MSERMKLIAGQRELLMSEALENAKDMTSCVAPFGLAAIFDTFSISKYILSNRAAMAWHGLLPIGRSEYL